MWTKNFLALNADNWGLAFVVIALEGMPPEGMPPDGDNVISLGMGIDVFIFVIISSFVFCNSSILISNFLGVPDKKSIKLFISRVWLVANVFI